MGEKVTCAALVLAGGRSSRMGEDKALLDWGGETLLERAVRFWRASGLVERVLVAVGSQQHFSSLPDGAEAVPDLQSGQGPMAGIVAGFRATNAAVLYVSAVDMPNLTTEAVLPVPEHDAAVYRLNGRREPLFAVYRRSILPVAERLLAEHCGKVGAMLDEVQTDYYYAPPCLASVFQNVNTPEEQLFARAGTPPMVTVMGWANSGKTTFLQGLIPALTCRGLRIAVVKHDAHGVAVDHEGKDTWVLAQAGATTTAILGPNQWAVMSSTECDLDGLRRKLPPVDLILGEGFKFSHLPKIEVHRKANEHALITRDSTLIALITDEALDTPAPQFALDDFEGCAERICRCFGLGDECHSERSEESF